MMLHQPGPVRRAAGGGAVLAVLLSGAAAVAAAPARAVPDPEPPAVLSLGSHGAAALPRPAGALTEAHFATYQYTVSGLRPDGRPVTGAELVVDTSGAKDVAEFRFPASCRVTEVQATCPVALPDEAHDPGAVLPFLVRPRLGSAAGDRGVVKATVRADNARMADERPAETEVRVEDRDAVADGGFPEPPQLDVAPGGRAGFSFDVTNIGARPLDRVTLVADGFDGDRAVTLPGDHGNCWYRTAGPAKPGSARIGMACTIDTVLEPGRTYTVAPEIQVALAGLAESGRVEVYATTAAVERTGVRGGAAPLTLAPRTSPLPPRVPRPVDTEVTWARNVLAVRSAAAADGAAVGASARTVVGEEFTAEVGVENRGRAALAAPGVLVEVPRGVEVVRPDDRCTPKAWPDGGKGGKPSFGDRPGDVAPVPSGAVYRCTDDAALEPGGKRLFAFTLKAARALDEARGVVFVPVESPYDAEQRSRVAFLTVSASAAGGAGPSPGGSPSATAAPTASASPSAAAPSTGGPAAQGDPGALAESGADDTLVLGGAAAVLTAAGAATFLAVRRRRGSTAGGL
ncbi:hypothetical protein [Streptomyces sp. CC210A]|uniref:hypothetical protein n=1 Tax=Streptomyces sp. CC210A TaxID=2898184 RepID=UPI001F3B0273|nr:hypothetical protein [Streptomyces sp. CC210A]